MRIVCVGGGPAGLYFSILAKLRDPAHDVTVFERNKEGATYGWGVTLEQEFLRQLAELDPESAETIQQSSLNWRDQVININASRDVNSDYNVGCSVSRQRLVDILATRARDLGVDIQYEREISDPAEIPDADLIVAADGVGSKVRNSSEAFGSSVSLGRNKYIWLGTNASFDSFNFFFVPTSAGWIWAYAYTHERGTSTFIVECSPETWARLGFGDNQIDYTLSSLERIFEDHLGGGRLMGHFPDGTCAPWLNFRTMTNENWQDDRVVLIGDSAHTAHFSVGLGTTLALQDAIALSECLEHADDLDSSLLAYQEKRQAELSLHATEALRSATWFENASRYTRLEPHQFARLLHSRRARMVSVLPPRLFYQISKAMERSVVLRGLRTAASAMVHRSIPGKASPAR